MDAANSDRDSLLQFAILGEIVPHFASAARHGEQTSQVRCCTEAKTPLFNDDHLHMSLLQGNGISPKNKTKEMLIRFLEYSLGCWRRLPALGKLLLPVLGSLHR